MNKPILMGLLLLLRTAYSAQAQSTTGGQSGGSTASTGAGYTVESKVKAAAHKPASMTSTNPNPAQGGFVEKPVGRAASSTRGQTSRRGSTAGKPRSVTATPGRKNP